METLAASRIIVSGTAARSGASFMGVGLACELKRRGLGLSVCVISPNLHQAIIYRRLIGRAVRCLDDRLLTPGQNLVAAYQSSIGADLVLIEGAAGGLYDGSSPTSWRGSTAEMAALIHAPVALVTDPRGYGNSLGALIRGYVECARDFEVGGVILNRVPLLEERKDQVREQYDSIMQTFGMRPVLGMVPELKSSVDLPTGSLRQDLNRTSLPRQFLVELTGLVNRYVDVDALLTAAARATEIRINDYDHRTTERRARIAVSDDSCFSLLFQDNLDLLRYYGAEIVTFSPLADSALPRKVGAVYLSGAYLGEYGAEVAANTSMKDSIRDFAENGGVLYSEGSGTAYLSKSFKTTSGETHEGVGVIKGAAVPNSGSFAYIDTVTVDESIFGRAGLIVKGVSTG
ncbi:MAG: AAA family ATPase, partial [Deltaproteobacteria bacterium]|nr:AAA family ATPase [Deltaproteobacteria bacterium]